MLTTTRLAGAAGTIIGAAAAVTGVVLPIPIGGVRLWHILMVLALCLVVLASPSGRLGSLRITSVDLLFVLFVAATGIAEVTNAAEIYSGFDLLNVLSPGYYFLGYLAARIVIDSLGTALWFLRGLTIACLVQSVVCILQFVSPAFLVATLSLCPSPGLEGRVSDGRLVRASGLVGHWTGVGFYFCAVLCCVLILWLNARAEGGPGFGRVEMSIGIAAVAGVMTTLTFSVMATAVVILIAGMIARRVRASAVIGASGLAAAFYLVFRGSLGERLSAQSLPTEVDVPSWVPNTIAFRWGVWVQETLPAILGRPFSGWGTNVYNSTAYGRREFPSSLVWNSAESQWLNMAVTYGIIATLVFLLLILRIISTVSITKLCASRGYVFCTAPMTALLVMSALSAFTVPVFTNRGLPAIMWPMVGTLIACRHVVLYVLPNDGSPVDTSLKSSESIQRVG